MTACILSVALLFTPPVAPTPSSVGVEGSSQPTFSLAPARLDFYQTWKDEGTWVPSPRIATVADSVLLTSLSLSTTPAESSFVPIASPALNVSPPPPPEDATPALAPPPELTLRERALNRFAELGAPQWVVNAFDCVGWRESRWLNVRSRTGDTGVLQINDVHNPELWRLGLSAWSPEDSATFSWLLFTRAGWSFRDWTVRGLCGLR